MDHFVMAITPAEAKDQQRINGSLPACALGRTRMNGGTQMRKIRLFAVAATLITTGVGAWAASTTDA
jgi:hypothetical protein